MIVLLSYNGDAATTEIIDWLDYYNCPYQRVNLDEEDFRNIQIEICNDLSTSVSLTLRNGNILDFADVSYFVYRGGSFSFNQQFQPGTIPIAVQKTYLNLEFTTLTDFFYQEVSKKCLGKISSKPLNKIQQLSTAKKHGIRIPHTFITNNKKHRGFDLNDGIITKAIQENIFISHEECFYDLKVTPLDSPQLAASFYPSLFQESIRKRIELRSFYIFGDFYTIAMQEFENAGNSVDFRVNTNNLRYSAYCLPACVSDKLRNMMNDLGLTSGSIDIVLGSDGEYYFLEVNPTGQFDWVSEHGNYYIGEIIARQLKIKYEEFNKRQPIAG